MTSRRNQPCRNSCAPTNLPCLEVEFSIDRHYGASGWSLVPGLTPECFFASAINCSTLSLPS